MEIPDEIRAQACKMICRKISPGASEVDLGVSLFTRLQPGTFTHSAIETVAELLVQQQQALPR